MILRFGGRDSFSELLTVDGDMVERDTNDEVASPENDNVGEPITEEEIKTALAAIKDG